MTQIDGSQPSPRGDWGYFGTVGWVLLAYVVASIVTFAVLYAWNPSIFPASFDVAKIMDDAWFVSVSTTITYALMVLMLIVGAWVVHWSATDYLALHWPDRHEVLVALLSLAILLLLLDGVSYLVGQTVVPPFATDIYKNAESTGAVPLLLFAIVIAAPVAEEIIFRGFIYRGWVRPYRSAMPAILVISFVFAIIHFQYNWFGIAQVFCIGFLLTWTRYRSGSTLLPIVMHVINNLYSMIQTAVVIRWWT